MSIVRVFLVALVVACSFGCSSDLVPQAHKGRMFDKTGLLAGYTGGDGFTGPLLGSGTYFTGIYDTVLLVDCVQDTTKMTLKALTKDNIQFSLDVYVTFGANCSDEKAVFALMNTIAPAVGEGHDGRTVHRSQVYHRYIRPAMGEAVRQAVGPHKANDINAERDRIFDKVTEKFAKSIAEISPPLVVVNDVKLNNLDFPESLDKANARRAQVAVEKDIAIAERQKVEEQIITAVKRAELTKAEGNADAMKIDEIGAAWRRNPQYLQLRMVQEAGQKGNMIITGSRSPTIMVSPKGAK